MLGLRMSARSHEILVDHDGGDAEAVTEDHCGSPERLLSWLAISGSYCPSFHVNRSHCCVVIVKIDAKPHQEGRG